MTKQLFGTLALILMAACSPTISSSDLPAASPATGAISGRVVDAVTGAPVIGASISTAPPATPATTGPDGSYSIPDAREGICAVTASKEGYLDETVSIAVTAGQTTTADVHLLPVQALTPTPAATATPLPTLTSTPLPQRAGRGGGVLAIASKRLGLLILNGDGTQRAPLDYNGVTLSWSPDGQWLAYGVEKDDGSGAEIYKVKVDGTGAANLTNNPASDREPAWSPDGTQIAFISDRDGGQDLYLMDTDGGRQIRLTTNMEVDTEKEGVGVNVPVWSPDSQRIAFVSSLSGSSGIYVVDADGSNLTYLSANGMSDRDPNWAPDGQKIAFVSDVVSESDWHSDIFVMNPDGSGRANLTNNPASDGEPDWSPDGRRIAFSSDRNCCENPTDWRSELHIMNADGSGIFLLSRHTGEFGIDFAPDWSPDGRHIAFVVSGWEAEKEWFVIGADGSGRTSLYYDGCDYQSPRLAWQPQ